MKKQSGFSLIELLTVIAIIGILAAVIFPVMGAARANARRSQCMTNLNQIQTALKLYKNDNRRYPPVLFGYVEDSSGNQIAGGTGVPMDSIRNGTLFREYVGNIKAFHCPDSPYNDTQTGVADPLAGGNIPGLDRPASRALYIYSSYDVQVLGYDPNNPKPRYTLAWASNPSEVASINPGIPANEQTIVFARQLKFMNPPDDTVVTWCSYHRGGNQSPDRSGVVDLVLFLDGHVDRYQSRLVGPNGTGTDWRYPYTLKPKP